MEMWQKLNLKKDVTLAVWGLPASLGLFYDSLGQSVVLEQADAGIRRREPVSQALVFVRSREELATGWEALLPRLTADPVLWFAYPKKSSSQYGGDLYRDQGWEALEKAGFGPVRQVALDDDWSALRFRPENLIHRRKGE